MMKVSLVSQIFVTALTDVLWTIDGHHHVFSNQSIIILSQFVGYSGTSDRGPSEKGTTFQQRIHFWNPFP